MRPGNERYGRTAGGPRSPDRAAVVAGLGAAVPQTVVTNDDLAGVLDTDDAWIRRRTGIRQRRAIAPGQATSDLAVEAARNALASAGTADAGAVVLATSTPDQLCPATAPNVASRIGLGPVPAFDVQAVCTGFVYALASGAGLISLGVVDSVLVIGADTFSTILDPEDRATRVVFGDGAGAVLLRAGSRTEPGALLDFSLGSDGSSVDLIGMGAGGSRQRSTGLPAKAEDTYFSMRGQAVFKQAVSRMAESAQDIAARTGWAVEEVDSFVFHQANSRILAAVARQLGVPVERFRTNIADLGNTVAASIPLALADATAEGELTPGQKVVLTGFGGGLTWGSTAVVWPGLEPLRTELSTEAGDFLPKYR
ncbi:beta-ketoacyl-ACP synthase III [Streptomyces sp. NPDC004232]|uniref:beta-ketoacyl-ACP synthase III n=1 Tax=Streptomyces sp. NPDC004232 TaxID=3154454 RepID=UPI001E117B9F|nr:ketoacyl-ACP synthase III [Streptomyces sp. tea 10]